MTRKTPSDLAWSKTTQIKELSKNHEEIPFTLDSTAIAEALAPKIQVKRSDQDERLIKYMFYGIIILSISSFLCALISLISLFRVLNK
jgi:hypothetical protein